jgi:DNA-directed RNA polymerase II subunit RPB2|uniref:DNA-directed RNA polymerase n=1 Tax=viral metagenome TaxID=1070528 RepID=A0A6C0J1Q7_9ZZZZ
MLTEKRTWEILGDHFSKKGFVSHQVDSFNEFIQNGISRIIAEESAIYIESDDPKNFINYTVTFDDVFIPSPTVIEESREMRDLFPSEARTRDLTYDSPIYVTVTETTKTTDSVEVNKHTRILLGRIPLMLRSNLCHLSSCTKNERITHGECEYDEGGYFIIKGKERVLIAQLRNTYNIPLVLDQKPGSKYKFVCDIRSMSEETGHSVLVQANFSTDERILNFSLPYIKEPIPIGVVFKALGYSSEEIKMLIGLNCEMAEKYIKLIINDSFFVEENNGIELFEEDLKEEFPDKFEDTDMTANLVEMWEDLSEQEKISYNKKATQRRALKYIGSFAKNPQKENEKHLYAEQVVNNEIFPHMGVTSSTKEKALLLGHMIHKLLATIIGIRMPDDRDNYINKRVDSPGMLCHELFRQLYKKYINSIFQQLEKKKQFPDVMSLIPRMTDITKGFIQCFSKGNWGVPKASYVKPGVAQILSRLSFGATLSSLRRVAIPKAKESKNAAIRQINPSQIMFICPVETPEGQPVGVVLNLSLLTHISNRIPTVLLKETVEMCEHIINIDDYDITLELTKVFINGILVGLTEDAYCLLDELKEFRNIKMIPWCVSLSYDDIDDEIHICSDDGRLLRPVFNVKDNNLCITEEDGVDWDNLVEKGLVTYIDNMEANNAVIAFKQNELKNYHNDFCEIAPAMMLGVMANIIPFPDHSQSPRNTYQAAMGKQAMSMFALSHLIRTDTVVHILNAPQKPLVGTKAGELMGFHDMPSGNNAIVAIACYTGFNQEDSVILNHSAVQRGLFWATTYKTHASIENKDGYISEKIGNPPLKYRKNDANYGLLDENGIIKTRHPTWIDQDGKEQGGGAIYVQKGDVIIGKMLIQNDKDGVENITDISEIIKKGDEGYIDKVYYSITPNGYQLVKITISKVRIPEVGDKFASRAAQKGTVGMVYKQEDMPWTQEGVVPDIIINPHAIPSRMTINQLMESVLGKSCAIEGTFGDSTPFTESSVPNEEGKSIAEQICERLGMNGYQGNGNETLYNGMTGEPMGEFFIGPVYYQRLKHLVSDKIHARDTGPVTTLTRQPLEGRSREGGLRFGEMERDCMIAHGNSKFLQERLFEQSDKYEVTVCQQCGNFTSSKNSCDFCETDEVSRVKLPYVSKLVLQELNAMLIKTKINVK